MRDRVDPRVLLTSTLVGLVLGLVFGLAESGTVGNAALWAAIGSVGLGAGSGARGVDHEVDGMRPAVRRHHAGDVRWHAVDHRAGRPGRSTRGVSGASRWLRGQSMERAHGWARTGGGAHSRLRCAAGREGAASPTATVDGGRRPAPGTITLCQILIVPVRVLRRDTRISAAARRRSSAAI